MFYISNIFKQVINKMCIKNNFNAKELPSQDYLLEALDYNSETGEVFWKERPLYHFKNNIGVMKRCSNRWVGKLINSKTKKGYSTIEIDDARYGLHRIIWKLVYNEEPNIIDHINGIKDDNRICNLRNVTVNKNNCNINGLLTKNSSGYTGAFLCKRTNRWKAKISYNDKQIHLGTYITLEEAALAYNLKYLELYGEEFYFRNENNRILLEELKEKVDVIKQERNSMI